jgi:hypothetical protein
MNNCINCKEQVNWNYCPNCGRPAKLKKIDRHYILSEIGDFLCANKGMVYTTKRIIVSPGKSVRQFLIEDRYRFVKPITFLFITSLIYTLACQFFHIDAKDFYLKQPEVEFPTVNLFINWMTDYQGYASIISGLFVALFVKWFFRKSEYNIFEIFILLCFISGISALFSTLMIILKGLTHWNLISSSGFIVILYYSWAIGQFFDKRKWTRYIKAFLSCLLGFFIFGLLVACVGIFIDIMMNH